MVRYTGMNLKKWHALSKYSSLQNIKRQPVVVSEGRGWWSELKNFTLLGLFHSHQNLVPLILNFFFTSESSFKLQFVRRTAAVLDINIFPRCFGIFSYIPFLQLAFSVLSSSLRFICLAFVGWRRNICLFLIYWTILTTNKRT